MSTFKPTYAAISAAGPACSCSSRRSPASSASTPPSTRAASITIFDFNRLRRASPDSGVVIAASIFLDIFNVFLLLLDLFGGQRE